MNPGGITHVRIGGEVRGPFRLAQLIELAEGGAITPATEAALAADGPWSPVQAWPECAQIFPPRAARGFKATEFTSVNRDSAPPVDHRDVIAWANRPPPPGVKPAIPTPPKPEPVSEVAEMVREVARIDALRAKPEVITPRKNANRRLVHYFILAALGNGVLAGIMFHYDALSDEWSRMIIFGWAGLYNAALAAIMLVMVPRY